VGGLCCIVETKKVNAIIFTSASTVQSFFEIMRRLSYDTYSVISNVKAIIAIGPATSEELRKRNIKAFESKEHTIRGTLELAKILLNEKSQY